MARLVAGRVATERVELAPQRDRDLVQAALLGHGRRAAQGVGIVGDQARSGLPARRLGCLRPTTG
jgi:hypothetical protein